MCQKLWMKPRMHKNVFGTYAKSVQRLVCKYDFFWEFMKTSMYGQSAIL